VFCPSADDIAQFSKLTHNDHFIHLDDPRRALVQGNLYLATMLHVLDDFCREANEAAKAAWRDGGGALPRYFVRSLSYSILRPMVAGSKLRVCWKVDERERERQGGNDKGTGGVMWRDQDWPIWIEAADGGMVVKATVTVKCVTRRDTKNSEKEV
jgi:hydroxyacyl-ACP dehydratase HTD2-like protein with hotdog domain